MSKLLKFFLSLVIKKRKRVKVSEVLSKQAREQIKLLRDKGLQLPIVSL